MSSGHGHFRGISWCQVAALHDPPCYISPPAAVLRPSEAQ